MTLGSHQRTVGRTQTWITPKAILDAVGPFDLDPCAASPRPWDCAADNWTHSGMDAEWRGRVWLNPPFNRYEVAKWVGKLARHQNGTALLHVRTEADWFEPVWLRAHAILFLADRLYFHYPDGRRAKANSGAPACLVAFSSYDVQRLRGSGLRGYLCEAWSKQ